MEPASKISHLSFQTMFSTPGEPELKNDVRNLMEEIEQSPNDKSNESGFLNRLENLAKKYQPSDIRKALNASYPPSGLFPAGTLEQKTLAGKFAEKGWTNAFNFVTNNGADLAENEIALIEVLRQLWLSIKLPSAKEIFTGLKATLPCDSKKIFDGLKATPNINWNLPLNSGGSTILALLAFRGMESEVKALLEIEDLDPNDPNSSGSSVNIPLHVATQTCNGSMVSILLSSPKTNVNQKDNQGETPIETALLGAKKSPVMANHYYKLIQSQFLPHPQFDPFTKMSDGQTSLLKFARDNNLEWLANALLDLQSQQQPAGEKFVMAEVGKRLGIDSSLYKQLQELDNRSKSYCAPFLSKLMQRQANLTDDEFITEVNGTLAKISALKIENTITETAKCLPKHSQLRMSLEELEHSKRAYAAQLLDQKFSEKSRFKMSKQELTSIVGLVLNQVQEIEEPENLKSQ